jgi:phytanoyl-CoA hydroxylase
MGLDPQSLEDLEHYIRLGYVIIPKAVSAEIVDHIIDDAHGFRDDPQHYVIRNKGVYTNPAELSELGIGDRIIDLYGVSEAARSAVFTPRVSAILQNAFGEPAIAIQSLYFEYGSQQSMHQDTAYVVSRRPLGLAAIWIALEDIQPGWGELCYYPGGHRFPHFLFGGTRKHWIQSKDGAEVHQQFFKHLHDHAAARGISEERFIARKGDVLVWHADLPHGGSRITEMHTRRSFVLHFAPKSVKANYMERIGSNYHELPAPGGNFFSSRHYQLQEIDERGRARVSFNGLKSP